MATTDRPSSPEATGGEQPARPTAGPGAERPAAAAPTSLRSRVATKVSIRTQRRTWDGRADTWDTHNDAGMQKVASRAMELSHVRPGMVCVDLGCGGGRLAIMLAKEGADVIGVDVSDAMIERMGAQARAEGIATIQGVVEPIEHFSLPTGSVDLVVTNYALHHLLDADKAKVVASAFDWLRPGGRLVVADMMLGRGSTARDRQVVAQKVRAMAKKGIPGYWRITKNAWRYLFRTHERPITPEAWTQLFDRAGFADVSSVDVVSEAAIVTGTRPA